MGIDEQVSHDDYDMVTESNALEDVEVNGGSEYEMVVRLGCLPKAYTIGVDCSTLIMQPREQAPKHA